MSMFESLRRIGAALKRASKRKETMPALNNSPTDVQKDIGWPEPARSDEIRLPF
jgi:hypothetical protein